MIQLFRSFQWVALVPLLGIATVLRLAVLAYDAPAAGPAPGADDGAWGLSLQEALAGLTWVQWGLGVVVATFVGFVGSFSIQQYRLATAGTAPTLVSILLASALLPWLGFDPRLLAALAIALAAHHLFNTYRQQSEALPIFNTGLYIGVAWMLHVSFVWFALGGLVALVQLRKVRGSDLLGYGLGVTVFPLLWLMWQYVFGGGASLDVAPLWQGAFVLPTLADLQAAVVPLGILAAITLGVVVAYGHLTTRRPVQEQRAHRMWYTLLFFGWVALLLSGSFAERPMAYVLAPLSVLLGVLLIELPRKPSNVILFASLLCILGGYGYVAMLE